MESQSFSIPTGTKLVVNQVDNRIIFEFVPEAPKFEVGDIVASNLWVTIYEGVFTESGGILNSTFVDLDTAKVHKRDAISRGCGFLNEFHIATEREQKIFFDAISLKGLQWNPDTKKVEKKRWRAEINGKYWALSLSERNPVVKYTEVNDRIDNSNQDSGNYFSTEVMATEAFNKVKQLLLSLQP